MKGNKNMDRLTGKTSIVTGAGEGIGRAIARMFAREGAQVVVANRNEAKGKETVDLIKDEGGQATFIRTDVTDVEDVKRLVEQTVATYGKLDVLCNNHGVYGLDTREITDLPEEDWDLMMDTNAKGVFLTTKYAIPAMRAAGGGSIVNISSIAALAKSAQPAYAASKGAVNAFTKGVATQVAEFNIRANVISPSSIETDRRTEVANSAEYKNDFQAHTSQEEAAGRVEIINRVLPGFGEPDDIAYAAVYLASDESAYVTATVLPVDGGTTRTRTD